ncbi:hypothetical protein [Bacillus sp. AFS055030]|nr:hypothetical protein [Bacillus sp. AFS055030]
MAKGHTNKGPQKSSVDEFGHSEESAYSKSKKMEEFHKKNVEKEN